MLANRNRYQDLGGLVLFTLAVFSALSLLSYNSADPVGTPVFPLNRIYRPDLLTYPPSDQVQNVCGRIGALCADVLFSLLGVGAYGITLSLGGVSILLLLGRPVTAPVLRLAGWLASLVGLTTVSAMLVPYWQDGPVIGPGGYLGVLCREVFQAYFGWLGTLLVGIVLFLAGLSLATDYVLVQGLVALVLWARRKRAARRPARAPGRAMPPSGRSGRDAPAIRIRGQAVIEDDDRDADEDEDRDDDECDEEKDSRDGDEDEDEQDDEDESEPPTTSAPGRRSIGRLIRAGMPALRIRRPPAAERLEVIEHLEQASRQVRSGDYDLPPGDLLLEGDHYSLDQQSKEVRRKAKILEKTFRDFGFAVKVVEVETGPVIAQYEVELEAGLRLSKIMSLADDLAIALRVPSVRIVAPIPGKNTVGIEVPNEQRQIVRLREVMEESAHLAQKMRIPLFLGKDVSGKPLVVDLSTLPHLLIAGRTGTGKSVCLNAIISSLLMTRRPDEVRMLMIDPKMVELIGYKTLPHLMHPVVTDMRKAEAILAWAVDKMEERYELLARAGVRHVSGYNQLGEEEIWERLQPDEAQRDAIPRHLPYIIIVADELADLMMTSGKEVEQHIIRLAQKSRAVGIHLILATQKPTVDVITGLIKSNLPARIAFQVASRTDSRVVLDEMGAEKLLGNGDMLFLWPGTSTLMRGQGTYLTDEEISAIVDFVSTGEQQFVKELVQMKIDATNSEPGSLARRDELYESAVEIVIREGRGSVSLLQRALGIGYGRAARLIDYMAEDGIVGPYNGSQARDVMITLSQWQRMLEGNAQSDDEPPQGTRATNTQQSGRSNTTGRRAATAASRSASTRNTHDDQGLMEELDDDDGAEYEGGGQDEDYDGEEYETEDYGDNRLTDEAETDEDQRDPDDEEDAEQEEEEDEEEDEEDEEPYDEDEPVDNSEEDFEGEDFEVEAYPPQRH